MNAYVAAQVRRLRGAWSTLHMRARGLRRRRAAAGTVVGFRVAATHGPPRPHLHAPAEPVMGHTHSTPAATG